MVEYSIALDDIFGALADRTRRDMLRRLSPGSHTVGSLAKHYNLTFAAVSKHLQVLERAKLVRKQRQGREQWVRLSPANLHKADKYLEQYRELWEEKLDRLEGFIKKN
jgi:DNA-binding transcriptional ArsR family regulator